MELDDKLCYCYSISKRKIVNFVKQTRPRRASQISACFEAGSGCGWCIPFLVKIHRQVMSGAEVEADDIAPAEYEAMRKRYRAAVNEGAAERNEYREPEDDSAEPAPPEAPGTRKPAEEPFDFTRYFSRSRPDPEPETLEEEEPRSRDDEPPGGKPA
jgi:bacterioferritin-associated ferredoxin